MPQFLISKLSEESRVKMTTIQEWSNLLLGSNKSYDFTKNLFNCGIELKW